jgi:uncharacterized protein YdeI (YjbR/CyaY-like superfamily)
MAEVFVAPDGRPAVQPGDRADWRAWLEANHASSTGAWLVTLKKSAGGPLAYADAIEELLCFGWIDSKAGKLDEGRSMLWTCPRKPKSGWSGLNKERVERLAAAGLMTPAGQRMVDLAKETGTWTALDDIERGIVPDDLAAAFAQVPGAFAQWESFSPSSRRVALLWISQAKRAETRAARIADTVQQARQGLKANEWKPKS